jgi:hypothetical protein
MRILLDECVPKALKRSFRPDQQVLTVAEAGWAGLKNGALLERASEQFDVFITVDGSIRHQQPLQKHQLIFVLLEAVRNDIILLEPLVPRVLEALIAAKPGQIVVIGA